MLKEIEYHQGRKIEADLPSFNEEEEETVEPVFNEEGDEYFKSLCGTLPEEVQKAYLGYNESFRAGYLALNRGDFKIAADHLSAGYQGGGESWGSARRSLQPAGREYLLERPGLGV